MNIIIDLKIVPVCDIDIPWSKQFKHSYDNYRCTITVCGFKIVLCFFDYSNTL